MAGRKSKTATVAKPQPKAKARAKTGGKPAAQGAASKGASAKRSVAKPSAVRANKSKPQVKYQAKSQAKPKSATRPKAARKVPEKAIDKVMAAAKGVKKNARKPSLAPSFRKTPAKPLDVYVELERLAAYIDAAKREIAEIRPQDVKEEYLPNATDELDAVVEATADATNAIMDSCELIEGVMGDVRGDLSTTLVDATTRIYEACTFQDITGQRIGKVVTALKNIEDRIDVLVETLGDETTKTKKNAAKPKEKKKMNDADLLEGPQLGDKAKSQAEIDDLLASFD